jgi:hypothetical protein
VFDGVFYNQKHGTAMGSPVSPLVANLYMETFEREAITSAPVTPLVWFRYVDDTFGVLPTEDINRFTEHLNSLSTHIKFTHELKAEKKLPFPDTLVHLNTDGSIKTTVYRKPTHTDLYLNFKSNHHLAHKRSVARTLLHRVETVVSTPEDQAAELSHVKQALRDNGYPDWIFKIPKKKQADKLKNNTTERVYPTAVIPYIRGLSEQLERAYAKHGVSIMHKPSNTIRQMLVQPKDKTSHLEKCGAVYLIKCNDYENLGEAAHSHECWRAFKRH